MQNKLIDAEDDDYIDLPSPNKQQLQLLIRQLQQGSKQLQIPSKMQLGGYLPDIAIAICQYKWSNESIDEIIKLITELTDMSAIVEEKIFQEINRQQNLFEKELQNAQFDLQKAQEFFSKFQKHYGLIISLHELGFDRSDQRLFEICDKLTKFLTRMLSGAQNQAMAGINIGIFNVYWEYLLDISFQAIYYILLILFTEDDCKIKCQPEQIPDLIKISEIQKSSFITTKLHPRHLEPYNQLIKSINQLLDRTYQVLNFINGQVSQEIQNKTKDNQNIVRQLAIRNTQVIRVYQRIAATFNRNSIICRQILSDLEEIQIVDLFRPKNSQKLKIIAFEPQIQNQELLFSSDSIKAQFTFSYPQEYFKQVDEMKEISLKRLENRLLRVNLLENNVFQYFQLCKSSDDIEFLSYLIMKRYQQDIQNMRVKLYYNLLYEWSNVESESLMRFIATFIYNGYQIEIEEEGKNHQLVLEILQMKPKRIQDKKQQYLSFVVNALNYRLINTAQIFKQIGSILKSYVKSDNINDKQQLFMLLCQFIQSTLQDCAIYDQYYLSLLYQELEKSVGRNEFVSYHQQEMENIIKQIKKLDEQFKQKRQEIQEQEKERERLKKEQERLEKLKVTNPKQYSKIIKRKQEERERKEKEQQEQLENERKLEEKKKKAPKYEQAQDIVNKYVEQLQEVESEEQIREIGQNYVNEIEKLRENLVKQQELLLQKHQQRLQNSENQQGQQVIQNKKDDIPYKLFKRVVTYFQDQIQLETYQGTYRFYQILNDNLQYQSFLKKLKYEQSVLQSDKYDVKVILCKLLIIQKQNKDLKQKLLELEKQIIKAYNIQLIMRIRCNKAQFMLNQNEGSVSNQILDILQKIDNLRSEIKETDQNTEQNSGISQFIELVQQCFNEENDWVVIDDQKVQQVLNDAKEYVQKQK